MMREALLTPHSLRSFPGPDRKGKNTVGPRKAFSALLLSRDPLPLEGIRKTFSEYGIELHAAGTPAEVDLWVRRRPLDLVLCDYDAPGAPELECLQPGTRWKGISMVVLRSAAARQARGKRIHVTLGKPLNADVLARGLKAAYTSMARRRIQAFRHMVALRPLAGTVLHHGSQRPLGRTVIANLSQTGLCLAGSEPLPQGGVVSVNFPLPDCDEQLHVVGTVIWSDPSGRSGVEFKGLSPSQVKQLEDRLRKRMPWAEFLRQPE
jgi:hypothetical protein